MSSQGDAGTLPLPRGQAHVWLCRPELVSGELLIRYESLLDDDEAGRRDRLAFEHLRRDFLVTRALCRSVLSRYHAAAPASWRFAVGPYGRPEVASPPQARWLRFNLSHTAGLVACLVTREVDAGVDVEARTRRGDWLAIASEHFAPDELALLRAARDEERPDLFFRIWTLKESYIKARGLGLALDLDRFGFPLESGASIGIRIDPGLHDLPSRWQFASREPTSDHVMAIAIARGEDPDFEIVERLVVPLAQPDRST